MKISVDSSTCEAHGQCNIIDPELFTLDDDGYSAVGQSKQVPAGKEDQARLGVSACPVMALSSEDE
jgi:ferredoxin